MPTDYRAEYMELRAGKVPVAEAEAIIMERCEADRARFRRELVGG